MCKVGFILVVSVVGTIALPTPEEPTVDLHGVQDSSRIIGGSVAATGSAPYMVALSTGLIFRSLLCGGSLISEKYVLTAAHCIEALYSSGSLIRSLRVTVGTNRWKRGGQKYSVARNITHQEFSSSIAKNDIGLLVTKSTVQLSQLVAPVPLSFEFVSGGIAARAAGWGIHTSRTRSTSLGLVTQLKKIIDPTLLQLSVIMSLSNNLLELTVETIDGQRCVEELAIAAAELNMILPPVNPEIELCTFHSANHGMCNGDSGSALVRLDNGQQIGIVSWGIQCARGAPDVFVRVSAYKDWIQQNVNE